MVAICISYNCSTDLTRTEIHSSTRKIYPLRGQSVTSVDPRFPRVDGTYRAKCYADTQVTVNVREM